MLHYNTPKLYHYQIGETIVHSGMKGTIQDIDILEINEIVVCLCTFKDLKNREFDVWLEQDEIKKYCEAAPRSFLDEIPQLKKIVEEQFEDGY